MHTSVVIKLLRYALFLTIKMNTMNYYLKQISLLFVISCFILSCNKDDSTNNNTLRTFGIFKVLEDDITVEMNGVINSNSLNNFNNLYSSFPNINKININQCDGSMDDETNLLLSKRVYDLSINTNLLDNGLIASGGVDFFLAGIQRTKGTNTQIGVHSWSDGNGTQATNFPVGHANHLSYINYYISVGFAQQQAEDFYYFTINAANAENIHWMTDVEIVTYNILTQ